MLYINDPDSQQGLPPFFFPGMQARCFLLEARLEALQAYCDAYMNAFPRFRFEAFAPIVYLAVNNYPRMVSEYPGAREMGYSKQQEFTLSFPVIVHDNEAGDGLLPRMTWVFPFLGVDNSTSAFSGQEVLGFAKLLGDVSFVDDLAAPSFRSTVRMPGFISFAPEHQEKMHTLIEVEASDAGSWLPHLPGHGAGFAWLVALFEDLAAAWLNLIDPESMSVTNLLQLRDGSSPMMAAYSALVHCHWTFENFRDPVFYATSEVRMFPLVTAEIVDLLGLKYDDELNPAHHPDANGQTTTRQGVRIVPKFAWGFTADMRFADVEHLIQYP